MIVPIQLDRDKLLLILSLLIVIQLNKCERVLVKIYDHRSYYDPPEMYGKGVWKHFSHGYGINYGYEPDGSYGHENGYGFIKAFAKEFCKPGTKCYSPDPDFWYKTSLKANGLSSEPYFGHPPADVYQPQSPIVNFIEDDSRTKAWREYVKNYNGVYYY